MRARGGAGNTGARDDRFLLRTQGHRGRAAIGDRHRPLEPSTAAPGPHLATLNDMVFFNDAANCRSSSSRGNARVSRLPNVRITSSGA